jgi:hypothetical protein
MSFAKTAKKPAGGQLAPALARVPIDISNIENSITKVSETQ